MLEYKILQLQGHADWKFCSWNSEYTQKNFNLKAYTEVYKGEYDPTGRTTKQILEVLFKKFNVKRPEDFHGHSLSISDIVVIKRGSHTRYYYCGSFGWTQLAVGKLTKSPAS